jgi:VWFA-related protein
MNKMSAAAVILASAGILAPVREAPAQQSQSASSVPVNMVVTVEARHGDNVPAIDRQDVMVYQGRDRSQVTDWVPLRGDRAGLQLALLLDDSLDSSVGIQFSDLRKFIDAQPASTAIAVGYMQNGAVRMSQDFTTDHALADKGLRLPLGSPGVAASPYLALSDLIKRWPEGKLRRAVLMISDGIDRLGGTGLQNPYVEAAIDDARRAGVIVYAIYATGAGHYGHSFWRVNSGQTWLSQIADQTGGEAYYLGFQTSVAFGPYLDNITRRLQNQYLLTFLARPQKKAGFQNVKLRTEVPNADLVAADAVWVPASE